MPGLLSGSLGLCGPRRGGGWSCALERKAGEDHRAGLGASRTRPCAHTPLSRVLKAWGSLCLRGRGAGEALSLSLPEGQPPLPVQQRATVSTGPLDMAWLVVTPNEVPEGWGAPVGWRQTDGRTGPLDSETPGFTFGFRNSWVQIPALPLGRQGTSQPLSVPICRMG